MLLLPETSSRMAQRVAIHKCFLQPGLLDPHVCPYPWVSVITCAGPH
jgi:hypothetical protein